MKKSAVLLGTAALVGGLMYTSQRIAHYGTVVPRVLSRFNTQVHRINQASHAPVLITATPRSRRDPGP